MATCLVLDKKIRLLQEINPESPELDSTQSLYDEMTSLWGQAIAASKTFLPRLRRRLVLV